jgi:hypothetical protein
MVPSRHEKERRRQRLEQIRQRVLEAEAAQSPPATPSKFNILTLSKLLLTKSIPGVVLYCRVSSRGQDVRCQLRGARAHVLQLGVRVLAAFAGIESGKSHTEDGRPILMKAIQAARIRNAPLVVVCASRLVRNSGYDPHRNPDVMPTQDEFETILRLAEGVQICTLNDPDDDPPGDESFLRQLNAEVKRKPVGRPRKRGAGDRKARKAQWLEQARLWRAEGWSIRDIAQQISTEDGSRIGTMTVWGWLHNAPKATPV